MKLIDYMQQRGIEFEQDGNCIKVGGYLYLRGTQITQLPDNLSVGGSLNLEGTQITQLPDNLSVSGSLDLRGTQITQLPDNLSVSGSLNLEGTQITQLPDNLSVGGSLYFRGTQITQLPDNFECESLYLTPENFEFVTSAKNCGDYGREIFCVFNKNDFYIAAGCFFGTFSSFREAVKRKYSGESAAEYIAKAKSCVDELSSKMKIAA